MLAALIQNNQNVPLPQPKIIGPGWEGFGEGEGAGDDIECPFLEVVATCLDVEVCATFLDVLCVERGNLIDFIATFPGEPEEVHFVYTKPGHNRPIADPGFGRPGSKIVQIEPCVYVYTIDTTGFEGGPIDWHMWGTGEHQRSAFGSVEITVRKPQLL